MIAIPALRKWGKKTALTKTERSFQWLLAHGNLLDKREKVTSSGQNRRGSCRLGGRVRLTLHRESHIGGSKKTNRMKAIITRDQHGDDKKSTGEESWGGFGGKL